MKPAAWLGVAFVLVVLGFIVYSSLHTARYRCEVCLTFNGRTDCRTAGAETRDHAMRTAIDNVCGLLASGVTETMQCGQTRPNSVRWIE